MYTSAVQVSLYQIQGQMCWEPALLHFLLRVVTVGLCWALRAKLWAACAPELVVRWCSLLVPKAA